MEILLDVEEYTHRFGKFKLTYSLRNLRESGSVNSFNFAFPYLIILVASIVKEIESATIFNFGFL